METKGAARRDYPPHLALSRSSERSTGKWPGAAPVRWPRVRWGEQPRRPVAELRVKAVHSGRHGAQYVLPGSREEEVEDGSSAACSGLMWAHTGLCELCESGAQLPVEVHGRQGGERLPRERESTVVGTAPGFNDWVRGEEPEMEEEKELSEGQLHPESGVLLRLGTQDCQNSVPAHRRCRQHSNRQLW